MCSYWLINPTIPYELDILEAKFFFKYLFTINFLKYS